MAGLSSPGVGSGLDINSLVSKLMDVERQPITALDKKEADYQAKITAYGTLKGGMSSLQTAVRGLVSPSAFNSYKATAGDATVVSASTSSIAKAASYSVEVINLAQVHKISSIAQTDPTSAVGTGTLTIDFGTYDSGGNSFSVNSQKTAKTITIGDNDSSLNGIRDAINNANAGVTASIVNDGSGYRLTISSNEAGVENSLRIMVDEGTGGTNTNLTGLSQLAYDPEAVANSGKNMSQTQEAKSASVKIDGLTITKPTNTITDAIQGVTLNLLKANVGAATTLTVARDTAGVKTAVEGFVKSYNDLAATIQTLGGYDAKTQKGGLLLGDTTLRSVQAQLRSLINQRLDDSGSGLSTISEIGVSFQRDGTLAINSTKLDAVLADSTKNVGSIFSTMGNASDSLVSYAGSTSYTKTGTYGLVLTQIGTRGTAVGQTPVGLTTTISSSNNQLTLSVDGTSATVTLNAGDYSAETLAAEVQARINSDTTLSALGKQVSVTQSGGTLTLTSNKYGSTSSVEVSGGSAAGTLFGSTLSTTGMDVAGTIGGIGATGSGQVLTATGDASGLQLLISGGTAAAAGTARGTVSFSMGIAYQLDQALGNMLASTGTLANKTNGISSTIKDIDSRREVLNKRLADVEARYRKQFNALDSLVASMQQTSTYLTQQLDNLPGVTRTK
ncbi:MAG: flagellar filament capping protein FliD [Sterolibacterium sp.]|nr:flagellar filament capping protein FliD [Sterolibacterium sp.]